MQSRMAALKEESTPRKIKKERHNQPVTKVATPAKVEQKFQLPKPSKKTKVPIFDEVSL